MARKSKHRRRNSKPNRAVEFESSIATTNGLNPTESLAEAESVQVETSDQCDDRLVDQFDLEDVACETVAETDQPASELADQSELREAVAANTLLLERIQAQLDGLCQGMVSHMNQSTASIVADETSQVSAIENNADETADLREQIFDLEAKISELEQRNSDLVTQVASANMRESVETIVSSDETLSWEDRKQLILQQMEDDSFDSDDFAESLANDVNQEFNGCEDPAQYIRSLNEELARRDQSIKDLQHLLEQQSATAESGVSIGAAGIADMIDSDELVREERERLQQLQTEWEEKFRQSEIEASLERAKLSRERRELAAKQSELESELERLRLKSLQQSEKDGPRKWLSQLGLAST